jgi:hypothetical protein
MAKGATAATTTTMTIALKPQHPSQATSTLKVEHPESSKRVWNRTKVRTKIFLLKALSHVTCHTSHRCQQLHLWRLIPQQNSLQWTAAAQVPTSQFTSTTPRVTTQQHCWRRLTSSGDGLTVVETCRSQPCNSRIWAGATTSTLPRWCSIHPMSGAGNSFGSPSCQALGCCLRCPPISSLMVRMYAYYALVFVCVCVCD